MARRVSKRKRSSREDYMLKEQLKIEEGVFDNRTMMMLSKLFTHKIISALRFIIAKGKEGNVYLANAGEEVKAEYVAVKIFRIETSSFHNRVDYMIGDPRFPKIKKSLFWIVNEWCKKEFGNLKIAHAAKIHAPVPYYFGGNVLAMEFLGDSDNLAPKLKDVVVENPKLVLKTIIKDIKKLYEYELVHADMSEYNILMKDGVPYMIDFGQAVIAKHPNAMMFLRRDVYNITKYFQRKYRFETDPDVAYDYVTGKNKTYSL